MLLEVKWWPSSSEKPAVERQGILEWRGHGPTPLGPTEPATISSSWEFVGQEVSLLKQALRAAKQLGGRRRME